MLLGDKVFNLIKYIRAALSFKSDKHFPKKIPSKRDAVQHYYRQQFAKITTTSKNSVFSVPVRGLSMLTSTVSKFNNPPTFTKLIETYQVLSKQQCLSV
jgi:hypothetical protein